VAELEIRDGKVAIQKGGIALNTYVRWINKDQKEHTISSVEAPDKNETFESDKLKQDESYQFKFEIAGTYKYVIDGKEDVIYEVVVE
jgi:plastocyanin